jgi:hypothetical protein
VQLLGEGEYEDKDWKADLRKLLVQGPCKRAALARVSRSAIGKEFENCQHHELDHVHRP